MGIIKVDEELSFWKKRQKSKGCIWTWIPFDMATL